MGVALVVTGGIGSGKSAVGQLLASWGAHVVDADLLAREVVEPGSAGLSAIVDTFGSEVLDDLGALDRAALADRVFGRPDLLTRLEAIVHPLVEQLATQRLGAGDAAEVLVYEVPLPGRSPDFGPGRGTPVVVVVDAPDDQRRRRLADRGLSPEQITARMDAQPGREEWIALADRLVDNSGDREKLRHQVADLWTDLVGSPPRPTPAVGTGG